MQCALKVLDIADLRTDMKMQQLQAIEHAGAGQFLNQCYDLGAVQAELGFFPARILPVAFGN